MKVIIVGGVAGGASAAARLRRLDEHAEIIVFERGPYISYANCGLPYYLGRVIQNRDDLLLQTPESFWGRFRVDVRVKSEVVCIDNKAKKVKVRKTETGDVYWENYDKLILSPGAAAARPDSISGIDKPGVFTLRSVPDVMAIDRWILENRPTHVTIAGGGYVGVEAAENLRLRGLDVTLVEYESQIINSCDPEMSAIVQEEMERHGVELKLGCKIKAIEQAENSLRVVTDQGAVSTGLVILSVGIIPDSRLAKDAGLTLGVKGAIVVNDRMQTSDPDIYAVGDAVQTTELITQTEQYIGLAGPANRQGRIAADQVAGIDSRYQGTQGSSILKVFDLMVAGTGITEKTARRLGMAMDKLYLHSGAHAGYYPNSEPLTCKILFDPETGRLLGGQFVGREGADKRADALAVALRAKMTAKDLIAQELCYAPPFNSAKDPLNMAGFAIENILSGKVKNFHWEQVAVLDRSTVTLLDVRTEAEHKKEAVPDFVNIPLDQLRQRIFELPKEKPVYVHCFSGLRSYIACRILSAYGYDCYNISGGIYMYKWSAVR